MTPADRDHYRLSTGRMFYANGGIIGLSPEHTTRSVSEGYDGAIYMGDEHDEPEDRWTPAERQELAAYMVALWTRWGQLP